MTSLCENKCGKSIKIIALWIYSIILQNLFKQARSVNLISWLMWLLIFGQNSTPITKGKLYLKHERIVVYRSAESNFVKLDDSYIFHILENYWTKCVNIFQLAYLNMIYDFKIKINSSLLLVCPNDDYNMCSIDKHSHCHNARHNANKANVTTL